MVENKRDLKVVQRLMGHPIYNLVSKRFVEPLLEIQRTSIGLQLKNSRAQKANVKLGFSKTVLSLETQKLLKQQTNLTNSK